MSGRVGGYVGGGRFVVLTIIYIIALLPFVKLASFRAGKRPHRTVITCSVVRANG